ncbi:MAG: thioredoxin domain-containing protein [Deltaproteobacteria bacterium]|nr:thioredoxin domain-containing protein [Deltaproteobacteria bacterium]
MLLAYRYLFANRSLYIVFLLSIAGCSLGCATSQEERQLEPDVQSFEIGEPPKGRASNRLAGEKSPYLLQHASNPVDWFPWGDEAFEKARQEDKPIFLSIGYSTCHWCHVMERESFEDEEVAALLNESFIAIKVDREERPDIDHIYMTVCQLMTGSGGWPLTIFMTPDKEPFFAATYIPKESRFGRTGMLSLIPRIAEAWQSRRAELLDSARKIVSVLNNESKMPAGGEPGEDALHLGFHQLLRVFDHEHAGFGRGMKFPSPHQLVFLLRYWRRTGNDDALKMAERTLQSMRQGGIYDHVGFGFHRYSTDSEWLVPHFEKMLYDQALLLWAYTEAFDATRNPLYKKTAREIADYVLRDMTHPGGAFYSAEDADSQGEEGKFYLWTASQIRSLLDEKTAWIVLDWSGASDAGNFLEEGTGRSAGQNILHGKKSLDEVASRVGISVKEAEERLEAARKKLLDARSNRIRPLLDDKILTDWNGLMIGALSIAGRILNEPRFVDAAKRAEEFIRNRLIGEDARLLHRFRDNEAGLPAYLDDYAFLVFGLIELYEATFEIGYLREAIRLTNLTIDLFSDAKSGGFFLSAKDSEKTLIRPKDLYDGAIPSGSSVAFYNLVRLSRITGDPKLEEMIATTARSYNHEVSRHASAHSLFLAALGFVLGPSVEVVIAGRLESDSTDSFLRAMREQYTPNKVVVLRTKENAEEVASLAPYIADQVMLDGKATAYVCVEQSCSFPTTDPKAMLSYIRKRLTRKSGRR